MCVLKLIYVSKIHTYIPTHVYIRINIMYIHTYISIKDPEWPSGLVPARHAGAPGSLPGRSVYQRLISRIFTAGGSVAL